MDRGLTSIEKLAIEIGKIMEEQHNFTVNFFQINQWLRPELHAKGIEADEEGIHDAIWVLMTWFNSNTMKEFGLEKLITNRPHIHWG